MLISHLILRIVSYFQTQCLFHILSARDKVVESANSVDPDEVAHDEPPHQDLHCLPYSL